MTRILLGCALILAANTAMGQETVTACPSQQGLEQVIGSNGQITPDDCRQVRISSLESDGERLCLVDLSGEDDGLVDQLREAATTERWWMRCEDLARLAAPQ